MAAVSEPRRLRSHRENAANNGGSQYARESVARRIKPVRRALFSLTLTGAPPEQLSYSSRDPRRRPHAVLFLQVFADPAVF
jgi:hypothetical protein